MMTWRSQSLVLFYSKSKISNKTGQDFNFGPVEKDFLYGRTYLKWIVMVSISTCIYLNYPFYKGAWRYKDLYPLQSHRLTGLVHKAKADAISPTMYRVSAMIALILLQISFSHAFYFSSILFILPEIDI